MQDWRQSKLAFGVLILPPTAWLVIFFTAPLGIVWVYSFGERGPLGETLLDLSFANYARAVEWINVAILAKSAKIAVITTVLCIAVGFPISIGIAFSPPKHRNLLLLLVILPFWTNLLIRTYSWIAVLRTRGYVNFALEWIHDQLNWIFGAIRPEAAVGKFHPLELLYNEYAVIIGLVYVHLPFMILPLYATLEKLDKSYLEASLDLGAGHWRTFISVLTPLALPGIFTGTMLVFILSLGTFLTPDLLGGPDSIMIGNLIAQQFGQARDWPFGSALSFMLMYATFFFLWIKAVVARREGGVSY